MHGINIEKQGRIAQHQPVIYELQLSLHERSIFPLALDADLARDVGGMQQTAAHLLGGGLTTQASEC